MNPGIKKQGFGAKRSPKSIKPLIEKRRRARINASLEQLRKLLQTSPGPQNSRALSRLEKAQILEMTVQQLQQYKKQGDEVSDPAAAGTDSGAQAFYCSRFQTELPAQSSLCPLSPILLSTGTATASDARGTDTASSRLPHNRWTVLVAGLSCLNTITPSTRPLDPAKLPCYRNPYVAAMVSSILGERWSPP
ncbi:UNVERIFIED_CONTAM: hypothetical protein K2H54_021839 [Gekko kuhli]